MARWIIAFLAAGAIYIAGDISWVTLTRASIYQPTLGPLLAEKLNLAPGLAFYLVYLFGILVFAVAPGLNRSWIRSLALGALFGLVAYGTYDLTNQATLKLWSTRISLIDMGWGAVVTGAASAAGRLAANLVRSR